MLCRQHDDVFEEITPYKKKIRRRMSTTSSIRYSPALPRKFKTRSEARGGVLVYDDTPESRYFGLDKNLYLDLLTVGLDWDTLLLRDEGVGTIIKGREPPVIVSATKYSQCAVCVQVVRGDCKTWLKIMFWNIWAQCFDRLIMCVLCPSAPYIALWPSTSLRQL